MTGHSAVDLLIIGGGIQGTALAAASAQRNLSVTLCEQGDLANDLTYGSTKLLHEGLARFDFRFVRESLSEGKSLRQVAPHLIQPVPCIIPCNKSLGEMFRIQCKLFWHNQVKKRSLITSNFLSLERDHKTNPLNLSYRKGLTYTDYTLENARLAILNAMMAREYGAKISCYTKVVGAKSTPEGWLVTLENQQDHSRFHLQAQSIVNATGPWITSVMDSVFHLQTKTPVQFIKSRCLIVPKWYPNKFAYILPHQGNRLVFVIPYHNNFALICTTDVVLNNNRKQDDINDTDIKYLCEAVNTYFHKKINPKHIIKAFSEVRAKKCATGDSDMVSHKSHVEVYQNIHGFPLVSIIGGKSITFQNTVDKTFKALKPFLPNLNAYHVNKIHLPGAAGLEQGIQPYTLSLKSAYPFLNPSLLHRYTLSYGSLTNNLLQDVNALEDMGQHFGHGLYEREVTYLCQKEWAKNSDDILWRRTQLGLLFNVSQKLALDSWLAKTDNIFVPDIYPSYLKMPLSPVC